MIGKPIVTINNFSGSGDGGVYYNEGFVSVTEGGQSLLQEGLITTKGGEGVDNSDSGFTDISKVRAVSYVQALNGSSIYKLILDDVGQFFLKNILNTTFDNGEIFTTPTTGNYTYSTKPDLFQLPSGNLIYTNNIAVGLIIRGKCKTGSSTTKIVDTSGRNFTTLGVTTANSVTNLVTGVNYPITSISTTDSTNDTLNFTTSGDSNTANDEFLVLVHQKFDLNGTLTIPTFIGQPSQTYWSRQIKQFGDEFYILNGNYLAKLASDETVFEAGYKQLSKGFQATCFDINTDRMLIAARSVSQGFRLFLWDGYSDGFNNILKVDTEINAITNYRNGWVYFTDGVLYFTDGYQVTELSKYSDASIVSSGFHQPDHFNGIVTNGQAIFTFVSEDNNNRIWNAVYMYIPRVGWMVLPAILKSRLFGTVTSLSSKSYGTSTTSAYPTGIEVGLQYGTCNLTNDNFSSQYQNKAVVYFVRLPYTSQIKAIELNLGYSTTKYGLLSTASQAKISVNIGEGRGALFNLNVATSVPSTTTVTVNGASIPGKVGDEIQFMPGGTSQALNGERSFITSIANAGASNETWTISPAVSATVGTDHYMRVIKVKSTNPTSKTIGYDDLNDPLIFYVDKGFISDKLFIEIVVTGITTPMPVCINSIKVY